MVGRHPTAELVNTMLEQAAATLPDGGPGPVIHSDRGCHYRWPAWIALTESLGLTRSMSAKGCSPDNSAMEGFFGHLKTEAAYPEHWERPACDEVTARINEYIEWHNSERIKMGLDGQSPDQHRRSLGLMA